MVMGAGDCHKRSNECHHLQYICCTCTPCLLPNSNQTSQEQDVNVEKCCTLGASMSMAVCTASVQVCSSVYSDAPYMNNV